MQSLRMGSLHSTGHFEEKRIITWLKIDMICVSLILFVIMLVRKWSDYSVLWSRQTGILIVSLQGRQDLLFVFYRLRRRVVWDKAVTTLTLYQNNNINDVWIHRMNIIISWRIQLLLTLPGIHNFLYWRFWTIESIKM
jgi:hypothetical protein